MGMLHVQANISYKMFVHLHIWQQSSIKKIFLCILCKDYWKFYWSFILTRLSQNDEITVQSHLWEGPYLDNENIDGFRRHFPANTSIQQHVEASKINTFKLSTLLNCLCKNEIEMIYWKTTTTKTQHFLNFWIVNFALKQKMFSRISSFQQDWRYFKLLKTDLQLNKWCMHP
jgi:hypothetical protein